MTRPRTLAGAAIGLVLLVGLPGVPSAQVPGAPGVEDQGRSITYVGVLYDQSDFERLRVGRAGSWFPQFDAAAPVSGRPTDENAVDALPPWTTPLNHTTGPLDPGCDAEALVGGCVPTYLFRTFSQDGPARSAGGRASWDAFTLPDGTTGRSGAIVDPHTAENSNNTINRIQLRGGTPSTFFFHVVVDNTGREHDPVNAVRARGNVGPLDLDLQVESDDAPGACELVFNGTADVYTFRFDGFEQGDYLKLRLNGGPDGASFGGLLFDETFEPSGSFRRAPRGGPPTDGC